MIKGLTISDAVHRWVSGFYAVPRGIIEQLMMAYRDEWEEVTVMTEAQDEYYDDILPAWGMMWGFGDHCDDLWLENDDGIEIMSRCGFRIYHHEKYGYFFGMESGDCDFYSEYWIPLYKKRGLEWHDPDAEKEAQMLRKGYRKGQLGSTKVWLNESGAWISMTERLPEPDVDVLVYWFNHNTGLGYQEVMHQGGPAWRGIERKTHLELVAWMPLAEPPKMEETKEQMV